ncbi:hypothetical protein IWW56_000678 [Coemansia sp. RSA 2131]|nr:hypothetical protein IWW56_000678 [Coemansia sp. RSA 2131]
MAIPKALFKVGGIPFTRDSVLLLAVTGAGCVYGTYVMFSKFQEPGYEDGEGNNLVRNREPADFEECTA